MSYNRKPGQDARASTATSVPGGDPGESSPYHPSAVVLERIDAAIGELEAVRVEIHRALTEPEPVLLSVNQFIARTGLSRRTAFSRLHDGTIRSVKVGRRRLVPASEVERLAKGGVA